MYPIALRTARNAVVHPYGGASNRPGTMFVAPVKTHTDAAPRLIPFEFKTSDKYMLEVGDQYMRFIRNDAHVTDLTEAITGATAANPVVLTITGTTLANGDEVAIDGVVGMTELNGRRFIVANKATNTIELTDQVTGANVDGTSFTAYTSGGTSSRVYEISTPYLSADLSQLKYVQSADVMTLTHPTYETRDLSRLANDSWTLSVISFAPGQDHPTGLGITVNTTGSETQRYQVTAIADETFEESLPALSSTSQAITGATAANPVVLAVTSHPYANGDEIEVNGIVGMTELNGRRFTVANQATNTVELSGEDGTGHTAYTSGGTANATFARVTNGNSTQDNTIAWTAVAGAYRYAVYRESNGIFGFVGETADVSFEDDNIAPDLDVSPPRARNPFLLADSYPGASTYFEQRQVYGGSTEAPDTSYYSQTGNRKNMSTSEPIQADDAITATLNATQVNEIRHFHPGNDLLVFTSGSEWRVNSGSDSAFESSTIKQKPQSTWGSSHLRPIAVGNSVIFVEENEASVRVLGFSFQEDGYVGSDLSLLAPHLLETVGKTVADWSWAHSVEGRVHMVRSDGEMLTLTYDREQDVTAWTHWDTKGKFKTTGSLRHGASEIEDQVYFVVQRKINGNSVKYIEKLHSRIFQDVRDAFFVDCGLSLDSPVTITDVTSADPVVVTAASHGFENDDEVDIYDIEWTETLDTIGNPVAVDQLNTRRYTVANKTTNTFELNDSDGNAIDGSAFVAYVEGGTARKVVTTISGADHLEGETVVALSDGNVVTGLTVANGNVVLPRGASRVHLGLQYVSDLETLDIENPSGGTIQGKPVNVPRATVRFEKSRGLLIGPNKTSLVEMPQREFEAMSDPTELLTGDKEITIDADWNSKGRIFMRQINPLPMTVLAVIPDIDVGED